jgi:hypothetical protein
MTDRFLLLARGIDCSAILAQLDARPDLWNANPERLGEGPHRETDDIWVRYRDRSEIIDRQSIVEPHFSVWYPAWHALPALRPVVFQLSALVQSVHMGGILLTRIPPGCKVYPHDDLGTWHSEFHNAKVWLPLRANERCVNFSGDESVVMKAGEAWAFDNLLAHSVENDGDAERVALICCFRSE